MKYKKNQKKVIKLFFYSTIMHKNVYISKSRQDELKRISDMKSTINFDLEKCIYKKYLKIGFFHLKGTFT